MKANHEADGLAKLRVAADSTDCLDSPLTTIKVLKESNVKSNLGKHGKAWQNQNDYVIARTLWHEKNVERTKQLLKQKKNSVRVTTRVITENCTVGINLVY